MFPGQNRDGDYILFPGSSLQSSMALDGGFRANRQDFYSLNIPSLWPNKHLLSAERPHWTPTPQESREHRQSCTHSHTHTVTSNNTQDNFWRGLQYLQKTQGFFMLQEQKKTTGYRDLKPVIIKWFGIKN